MKARRQGQIQEKTVATAKARARMTIRAAGNTEGERKVLSLATGRRKSTDFQADKGRTRNSFTESG